MTLSTSEKKLHMLQLFTLEMSEPYPRNPWIFFIKKMLVLLMKKFWNVNKIYESLSLYKMTYLFEK